MFKRNNNSRLEIRIPAFCFQISNVKKTCFSMTNTLFFEKKSEQQWYIGLHFIFLNLL